MKRLSISVLLLTALAMMVGAAPAFGQYKQIRRGFWFNGGLGYGTLGCDNCGTRTGGVSGGLSLGGTLSPKFLLGVGTTGWTKSENGATLTVGTLDLRMRFYPSATGGFFLTAGIGAGSAKVSVNGLGSGSETGGGAIVGVGYDARIGPMVSLTPYVNVFGVKTANTNANVVQVGLSITLH